MSGPGGVLDGAIAPARPAGRRLLLVGAAAVALLVLVAIAFYRLGSTRAPVPATAPTPTATARRALTAAEVYDAVAPSVVFIESTIGNGSGSGTGGGTASGTGVIANADGTILTALHVVKNAETIRVTFGDGTTAVARISGADPANDIATLAPAALPAVVIPAVLGSSARLAVGDGVVAIGNPLGLTRTTTTGVVSGLNRSAHGTDGTDLAGLIQFDAAVNPGSSGGPLVNTRGETVGIVVALANPTSAGTFIGIGFAVPIGAAAGGGRGPQQ